MAHCHPGTWWVCVCACWGSTHRHTFMSPITVRVWLKWDWLQELFMEPLHLDIWTKKKRVPFPSEAYSIFNCVLSAKQQVYYSFADGSCTFLFSLSFSLYSEIFSHTHMRAIPNSCAETHSFNRTEKSMQYEAPRVLFLPWLFQTPACWHDGAKHVGTGRKIVSVQSRMTTHLHFAGVCM